MGSGSGKFADSGNRHHPQLVDAEDAPPSTATRVDFQQMLAAEREKAERECQRLHVVWSECQEERGYSLQKVIL